MRSLKMSEDKFSVVEMFKEAELGLAKYRNIIGIGVIVMFIVFSLVFGYTYYQERKIAEHCGFENEKIKCVCNKQAWDEYNMRQPQVIDINLTGMIEEGVG